MKCLVLAGLLGVMATTGCEQKLASAPPTHQLPTRAQPSLPTIRLWLGSADVSAELALTPIQQETGMMFRTNLDENAGMIFPLPQLEQASFWMTNCPLSLAAAYIDPKGEIREIHEMRAHDDNPVKSEAQNILYVLEVSPGWFDRHHIAPGTMVRTERGTLRETFRRANP